MKTYIVKKITEAKESLDALLAQASLGIDRHEGRVKDILHEIADDLQRTVVEKGDEIYLINRLEVEGGDYGTGPFKVDRIEDDGTCIITLTIGEPPTQYADDTYHDVEVQITQDAIDWEEKQ